MLRNCVLLSVLLVICTFNAACAAEAEPQGDNPSPPDPIASICDEWELLPSGERTPERREGFVARLKSAADADRKLKDRVESPQTGAVVGEVAIWAYAQMKGPAAAPALSKIVLNGKWSDATASAAALGAVGDEAAIPLLMPGLVSENQSCVLASTSALMFLSQNEKVAPLFIEKCNATFRDAPVPMKVNLLAALSRITTHAAEGVIEYGLEDESPQVQAAALALLTVAQVQKKELTLREMLHRSKVQDVLKRAANALGRAKCPDAIPDLIALLKGGDPAVTAAAHWALKNISDQQFAPDADTWQNWFNHETKLAAELQDSLLSQVRSGAAESKPLVIESAVQIIPLRVKLVPLLLDCKHDSNFCVRAAAYHALGQVGGLTSPTALLEGLTDPKPEVSHTAWRALQELTGQRFALNYLQWQEWCSVQR